MDAYTVSSSGSSSFCTNPTDRGHLTGAGDHVDGDTSSRKGDAVVAAAAARSALASSARQRRKETASTTMRKVNTDYSESLEQQNARAAALQRYKLLVRSSRLVPGAAEEESGKKAVHHHRQQAKEDEDDAAGVENASLRKSESRRRSRSSGARRSTGRGAGEDLPPVSYYSSDDEDEAERTSLGAVSEDSDAEGDAAGLDVAVSAVSNRRQGPRHSPSAPSQSRASAERQGKAAASSAERSPAARAAFPATTTAESTPLPTREKSRRKERETATASPTSASPSASARKPSAGKSKSRRASLTPAKDEPHRQHEAVPALPDKCPYPVSYENEAAPDYQPPEQTEPVIKPSHPRRDSIKPNYEPVSEGAVLAAGTSGSRRSRAAPPPAAVAETEETAAAAPTVQEGDRVPKRDCPNDADATDDGDSLSQGADTSSSKKIAARDGGDSKKRMPVAGGSATAFWIRPNSALFEQTASIAAKRKDHPPSKYEEEMGYARLDSGSTLHGSSATSPSNTQSRPSRRLSTRPEFDTRFSTRRSTTHDAGIGNETASSRSSAVVVARGGGGALRGTSQAVRLSRTGSVSSTLHDHGEQQQQQQQPRSPNKVCSPGSARAAPHTSAPKGSVSSASRSSFSGADDSRVSDRQSQYFAKHCSRLASGRQSRGGGGGGAADLQPLTPSSSTSARPRRSAAGPGPIRVDSSRSSTITGTSVYSAADGGQDKSSKPRSSKRRLVADAPELGSPAESRRVVAAPAAAKESPDVSKRLQFDLDAQQPNTARAIAKSAAREDEEAEEAPSPVRAAPRATPLDGGKSQSARPPPLTTRTAGRSGNRKDSHHADPAAAGNASLLVDTPLEFQLAAPSGQQQQQQQQQEGTPNKSRRTERSRVASESPARDECAAISAASADAALHEANRAIVDEAVRRHKAELSRARKVYEAVKANDASAVGSGRERSGSLPTTAQSRTRVATNEVVASMLQGIVQQSRRVLPCYLCAEMQNVGTYALHLDLCAAKTQLLLQGRGGPSEEAEQMVQEMGRRQLPTMSSTDAEKEAFSLDSYRCAKALLVPCGRCSHRVRVHDVKEHELLCGRSYYENGKAGQRHREAVHRIESGALEQPQQSPSL